MTETPNLLDGTEQFMRAAGQSIPTGTRRTGKLGLRKRKHGLEKLTALETIL